ncbi:class I SAM-dependent methyltransferase [Orenia marismortui]|uniref:class I SAM-dependent methyltransferase n=1 Tax=Orenia marismortui TaxID=46469 RepID=UPI0003A223FB|nr:class I SAM-dependent methyltransferase [Orenia marismortui]
MEYTGERVIPKKMSPKNGLLIEHIARYKFASQFIEGRVLDIACGSGYGTEILMAMGEGIKEIIGVDVDEETINYAKSNYQYPWNKFMVGNGVNDDLVQKLGEFDCIISMETVEHIKDDYKFIKNLKKMLKRNGKLIISTPFGRGRDYECSNPYHYRQYTEGEFRNLLSCFNEVEIYCQCDKTIEKAIEGKKYYLMLGVCND